MTIRQDKSKESNKRKRAKKSMRPTSRHGGTHVHTHKDLLKAQN